MADPVSLDELRVHLRLDTSEAGEADDNTDDAYLVGLLLAARRRVEHYTGRKFNGTPSISADDLPLAIHAIKVLCTAWYEDREGAGDMPRAVIALLKPLRIEGMP